MFGKVTIGEGRGGHHEEGRGGNNGEGRVGYHDDVWEG